jgi:signal transduction histidine kinase
LVKIENKLLNDRQHLDLQELVEDLLYQLEDIFGDKEITVTSMLNEKEIEASNYLIEILLNNLIINAVRHNRTGGEIIINLTTENLTIKNTGEQVALNPENIFTRFHKASTSEGSGLGLTISKQICESLGYQLVYSYEAPYHIFTVNF